MSEPITEAPDETTTDTPTEVEAEKVEIDWQAEARKWEKRAKENSSRLKEAEPKLAEWEQLREASKTQEERVQEELARAQSEAATWRAKAVLSRVEALASASFADPSDALTAIDPDEYLGLDGSIDEQALRDDLDELLRRKPHWAKASGPTGPRPDPGQGPRPPSPQSDEEAEYKRFFPNG